MDLNASIREIKGIGEKTEKRFAKFDITSVRDLLMFFPRTYDEYKSAVNIKDVKAGDICILELRPVNSPRLTRAKNLRILTCKMADDTGEIDVTWFNMPYMYRNIKPGTHYILRGRVVAGRGRLSLQQPKILTPGEYLKLKGTLQPVYPLKAGLTNNAVKKAIRQVLKETKQERDIFTSQMREEYDIIPVNTAIRQIHFPEDKKKYRLARKRLVFEEFFSFGLDMNRLKKDKHKLNSIYNIEVFDIEKTIKNKLSYKLTEAQEKTLEDIKKDISSGCVMNRLIQGDVGSGKTIVALIALAYVAACGHQGAIMVPTEVLAKQHYKTFEEIFDGTGIRIGLLTGSMTAASKRDIYEKMENHQVDIMVGTHALIQKKAVFCDLALIITDEQHRFGVRQREMLSKKGNQPHMLVMSATPIPRTLGIILYGDLDVSVIDALPSGRKPISNCVVGTNFRPQSYKFIEEQVKKGHQAYIICPMVDESEELEIENVTEYSQSLSGRFSSNIRIDTLHGKMKPDEKNDIMERFSRGETDVLVSTTVIEVGINVPNATVMMVENAERFGLATLHQLRGRVGRGDAESFCIFMTSNATEENMERLRILEKSNNGFVIAEEDLRLRGPGDFFGTRQSGGIEFKLGDIYNDAALLKKACEAAEKYADRYKDKVDTECIFL